MRCKLKVTKIGANTSGSHAEITLGSAVAGDGEPEATHGCHGARLKMWVDGPAAAGLKVGDCLYLELTDAPAEPEGAKAPAADDENDPHGNYALRVARDAERAAAKAAKAAPTTPEAA